MVENSNCASIIAQLASPQQRKRWGGEDQWSDLCFCFDLRLHCIWRLPVAHCSARSSNLLVKLARALCCTPQRTITRSMNQRHTCKNVNECTTENSATIVYISISWLPQKPWVPYCIVTFESCWGCRSKECRRDMCCRMDMGCFAR